MDSLNTENNDSSNLNSRDHARNEAIKAIKGASDFVVIHLNKEGGGTIGAVRSNRRKPIMQCLVETLKSMARTTLEDVMGEEHD